MAPKDSPSSTVKAPMRFKSRRNPWGRQAKLMCRKKAKKSKISPLILTYFMDTFKNFKFSTENLTKSNIQHLNGSELSRGYY